MGFFEQPTDLAKLAPSFGAAHLFIDDLSRACWLRRDDPVGARYRFQACFERWGDCHWSTQFMDCGTGVVGSPLRPRAGWFMVVLVAGRWVVRPGDAAAGCRAGPCRGATPSPGCPPWADGRWPNGLGQTVSYSDWPARVVGFAPTVALAQKEGHGDADAVDPELTPPASDEETRAATDAAKVLTDDGQPGVTF